MNKYFVFLITIFCFSCDQSNSNEELLVQEVYSTIEITNSPLASYSTNFGFDQTQIQVTDGSFLYTSDISEFYMMDEQIFYYPIQIGYQVFFDEYGMPIFGCSNVDVKTYHNNTLIDEQTFQMGLVSANPSIFCDPLISNNIFSANLSITAN